MKNLCVLGSTGSIGTQTLDVCRQYPEDFKILALSAKSNIYLLAKQIKEFKPKRVCLCDETKLDELQELLTDLDYEVKIHIGEFGLLRLVKMEKVDVVVNALVGFAGFYPTLEAIRKQKTIALANKESLVVGGAFIMKEARENNVDIIPIDSEHSAIFQAIGGNNNKDIKKIILTASGGPFFGKTAEELKSVTIEDALKHPNWSMGSKVTIDSATMMNKGLELIEARWLFNVKPEDIEIVVHRESIVHSLVEFVDNSVIAQLSTPDMRIPIQYSLTYPARFNSETKSLSLVECGKLTFKAPDEDTFVCLKACKEAIKRGGTYPAIVNGANEEAVKLFLDKQISFEEIGKIVMGSLDVGFDKRKIKLEDILTADKIGRNYANGYIKSRPNAKNENSQQSDLENILSIDNNTKDKKKKNKDKDKKKKDRKSKKNKNIIEENILESFLTSNETFEVASVDTLKKVDEVEEIEEIEEIVVETALEISDVVENIEENSNEFELTEENSKKKQKTKGFEIELDKDFFDLF